MLAFFVRCHARVRVKSKVRKIFIAIFVLSFWRVPNANGLQHARFPHTSRSLPPHVLTPLKNPPRCAVSPMAATPSSSTGIRYRGRGIGVLRVRQCTHHDVITNNVAVEAAMRCNSKRPLIFWSSRAKCQASQPVSTVGITVTAANDRFQYAALAN
jgi:hypothetical protein